MWQTLHNSISNLNKSNQTWILISLLFRVILTPNGILFGCQINRKSEITIHIWFDLTSFQTWREIVPKCDALVNLSIFMIKLNTAIIVNAHIY